jgi:hypothetical protein
MVPGVFAFQPGEHVTKHDFENDPSKIEGEWIGLYSYLGWADFEALRDGNPAVLEENRSGHLRDYLGGPQQLTIRLQKTEDEANSSENGRNSMVVIGEGVNGGAFTFTGRLRRVFLPTEIFGQEMHLYWRITFIKTYANGENSWTRWIYDGVYCPGKSLLNKADLGAGILGRWRDGTEPVGTGVTGPFWLWRRDHSKSTDESVYSGDDSAWTDTDVESGTPVESIESI